MLCASILRGSEAQGSETDSIVGIGCWNETIVILGSVGMDWSEDDGLPGVGRSKSAIVGFTSGVTLLYA